MPCTCSPALGLACKPKCGIVCKSDKSQLAGTPLLAVHFGATNTLKRVIDHGKVVFPTQNIVAQLLEKWQVHVLLGGMFVCKVLQASFC